MRFVLAVVLSAGAVAGFGSAFSGFSFCKGASAERSHCHRSHAEAQQADVPTPGE